MSAEPLTANSVLLAAMTVVGNDPTVIINYLADLLAQRTLALDAEQHTVTILREHLDAERRRSAELVAEANRIPATMPPHLRWRDGAGSGGEVDPDAAIATAPARPWVFDIDPLDADGLTGGWTGKFYYPDPEVECRSLRLYADTQGALRAIRFVEAASYHWERDRANAAIARREGLAAVAIGEARIYITDPETQAIRAQLAAIRATLEALPAPKVPA